MTTSRPLLTMAVSLAAVGFFASSCSIFGGDDDSDGGSASVETTSTSTDGSAAAPTAEGFKVIGKDIVDPDGNLFVPVGANVGPPLEDTEGNAIWHHTLDGDDITTPESEAAIEAWGWNFLRVNASCVPDEPNENNSGHGNAEMLAATEAVVDTYTPKGIVVMIDCHDFTAKPRDVGSPEWNEINDFWEEANDRYGENGYVWFNHLNEAHLPDQGVPTWQSQVDDGYDAFVEMGAKNLVVFDLPNQAQKLDVFQDSAIQEWAKTKCNVIWDWHAYGGLPTGTEDLKVPDQEQFEAEATKLVDQVAAADLPVVVGEFGFDWNGDRKASNFSYEAERVGALHALTSAPKHGYGLVAWHANGDSGTEMKYGLKKADKETFAQPAPGENLSEIGAKLWEHSQAQRDVAVQAGPTDEACTR